MDESIKIVFATTEDCPGLLRLIKDLADYEKMPHGPQIDSKTLEEDGFGERPYYYCIVAFDEEVDEEDGTRHLVGYALYHLNFTWCGRTVYMEDLYVSPSYRSKGIGTALWKSLLKDATFQGASCCIFSVLDWNAPSLVFYKSKGAQDLTSARGYRTFRISRDTSRRIAESGPVNDNVVVADTHSKSVRSSVVAAYREMAEEVGRAGDMELTERKLSSGLNSIPPWCHLLVASSRSGEFLGFLLYCLAYSTWEGVQLYIKDVFVRSPHRRTKVASTLLKALMKRGESLGCSRCDLVVSSGQDAGVQFFTHHGGVDLSAAEGWIHMILQRTHMQAILAN